LQKLILDTDCNESNLGWVSQVLLWKLILDCILCAGALEAGKHVLVEKPLVANPQEGSRLLEAARRHPNQVSYKQALVHPCMRLSLESANPGTQRSACLPVDDPACVHAWLPNRDPMSYSACQIGLTACCQVALVDHELRFVPAVLEARRMLAAGAIGRVYYAEATFFSGSIVSEYARKSWRTRLTICGT
jgi:Oxidoreductase family, NAD-binding Rossmann fold